MKKRIVLLFLISVNITYLLYMFTIEILILNYHTDIIEAANYDLIIQGFFDEDSYDILLQDDNINNISGTFTVRTNIINDTNKEKSYSFNFTDDIINLGTLLFNNKFITKGNFENGKAVITKDIAKRYDFKIDDDIIIEINKKKYNIPIGGILESNLRINNTIIADYDTIDTIDKNILYTQVYIQYNQLHQNLGVNKISNHSKLREKNFDFISRTEEITNSKTYANEVAKSFKMRKLIFLCTLIILVIVFVLNNKKENKKYIFMLLSCVVIFSLFLLICINYIVFRLLTNPLKLILEALLIK